MENEKEKISIILPIYNMERFLETTFESILNQSYKNLEIICVNDGSIDSSLTIINDYAKRDNRIVVISGPNRGPGAARNIGLERASGELISILDADDIYEKNMFKLMAEKLQQTNADMVISRCDGFDDKTNQIIKMDWSLQIPDKIKTPSFNCEEVQDSAFFISMGWAWDKLYKRDFIEKNNLRFQEIRHSDDAFFCLMSLILASKITFLNEVLIHHRTNVSTSTSRNRQSKFHLFFEPIKAIKNKLKEINKYDFYEKSFINWALQFSLWNYNTMDRAEKPLMHNFLKNFVFKELGLDNYNKEIFFNKKEYEQYLTINKFDMILNPISINVHGSCVTREIFNYDENGYFFVKNNIQRNSIESMVSDKLDIEPDCIKGLHDWEKRMLIFDFNKSALDKIVNDKTEFLAIDLIDERYNLCDICINNKHSIVTYNSLLESQFANIYNTKNYKGSMWTVIPKPSYPKKMIEKAFIKYVESITKAYPQERIIIVESFFVNSYIDKKGDKKEFSKDKIIEHSLYNLVLKYSYMILKKLLNKAHYIEMPKGVVANEGHKFGLLGVHYEDSYYINTIATIKKIAQETIRTKELESNENNMIN